MTAAVRDAPSCNRTEVLDVVGHDGSSFRGGLVHHLLVRATDEVGPLHHRVHVKAANAKHPGNLTRKLFVQKCLHEPSARRPASQLV